MPGMDGYEACQQIRSKEQLNNKTRTTIVALNAHASSDYQQQAKQAGMDIFLTKPLTFSDLWAVIKKVNEKLQLDQQAS